MRDKLKVCYLCGSDSELSIQDAEIVEDKHGKYYNKTHWCKKCRTPIIKTKREFKQKQEYIKSNKKSLRIAECETCNVEFKTHISNKRFCCNKCRERSSRRRNRAYLNSYQKKNKCSQKISKRNKSWVINYKKCNFCIDCNLSDWVVMDFDHVRGIKKANISTMVRQAYSIETIKEEVAKCDLVCANCHRKRTAKRQGWNKYM